MKSKTPVSRKKEIPAVRAAAPSQAVAAGTAQDNLVIAAWEFFADGAYRELRELARRHPAGSRPPEIDDLVALADFEESDGLRDPGAAGFPGSLFAELRAGMVACYRHDDRQTAALLGRWLTHKEYYCAPILRRFIEAARMAGEYRLLGEVARKFAGKAAYQRMAVGALFLALFHQDRLQEALAIFEKFREQFDDPAVLQKAALALLRLERYEDARELLGPLHTRLSGVDFQMRYDEVRASYAAAIAKRHDLAKKKNRTYEESMELGMAYLFGGEYQRALGVFQSLLNAKAA